MPLTRGLRLDDMKVIRRNNPEIGILQQLKYAWRNRPVDMTLIKELQEKLKKKKGKRKFTIDKMRM